jgi:two-component system, LuxR family, response regulator FixJ
MAGTEQHTVAIVDDDDAVRDSLRFLLEVIGHPVGTFAWVAEFPRTDLRHIGCLILDQNMPGKLAERLWTDGSLLPILSVTGPLSPSIAARATELGVNRGFDRPPGEEDVIDFITAMRS